MDRAPDSGSGCRGFKSLRTRKALKLKLTVPSSPFQAKYLIILEKWYNNQSSTINIVSYKLLMILLTICIPVIACQAKTPSMKTLSEI